jgi:hypothetical protein
MPPNRTLPTAETAAEVEALRLWQQAVITADATRLLGEAALDALCDIEDPIEAATMLLGNVAAVRRVFRGPLAPDPGRPGRDLPLGAVFLLGHPGDRHSWLTLYDVTLTKWTRAGVYSPELMRSARRDWLDVCFACGEAPVRLADALGDPALGQKMTIEQTSKLEATVQMWWDSRVSEGHTAESASLLLALTLAPANAALVSYDEHGHPVARMAPPVDDQTS